MRFFTAFKRMIVTWLEAEGKGNVSIGSAKSTASKFGDCRDGFAAIVKEKIKAGEKPVEITIRRFSESLQAWEWVKVQAWPIVPHYFADINDRLYRQGTVLSPGSPEIRPFYEGTVGGERELDKLHDALVDVYLDYIAHAVA